MSDQLSRQTPVSVERMQRIDQVAIETIGIPRLLLMDHAGLALARAVQELGVAAASEILICCGSGHNGGDGLASARHLERVGYQPSVILLTPRAQLKQEPACFAGILTRLDVPLLEVTSLQQMAAVTERLHRSAAIVDALLGIGLQGSVRPLYASVIAQLNDSGKPIISADIPSGLDADSGQPLGIAIRSRITVSFGLPKQGCLQPTAKEYVGRLVVDLITLPPRLLTP
ncbi:MAG: NAD(P)H-hydrate epimerase [Candidatus Omnitrophica bacterium]|nr:NAD(P)H-hydrate epimerase [Candidatus Omnitrophota bacterium]